ncbi:hypothetical protein [Bradyrhizobium sp. LTSPM299]|uniref:hypothetical protein n=1 Tax=Bradyrhizobium sp. LTSPM299 TaxID=1619233 RepID=UPI0012E21AB2|nr:hypothetical protein [Bradyrhizobium sp. LTSPM299]
MGIGVLDYGSLKDARAQALRCNHFEIVKRIVTVLLVVLVVSTGVVNIRRSTMDHRVAEPKKKPQSVIIEASSAVLPYRIDYSLGRPA